IARARELMLQKLRARFWLPSRHSLFIPLQPGNHRSSDTGFLFRCKIGAGVPSRIEVSFMQNLEKGKIAAARRALGFEHSNKGEPGRRLRGPEEGWLRQHRPRTRAAKGAKQRPLQSP